MRTSGTEAIAEWVNDCKRECAASGFRLKALIISEKNEPLTLAPLFYAVPSLSDKVFRIDDATKSVYLLDVRFKFTPKLPEGKFWMMMEKEKK